MVGGPGTGKTTTLVELVARRVEERGVALDRVLVLTHGRAGAHRLRSAIMQRLGRTESGTSVMTLHGLCRALVGQFGGGAPRLLTAPEQDFRIRELLDGLDTSGWPAELAAASGTREFAAQMRAAITRAQQLGLDPGDLVRLGEATGQEQWRVVGEFFEEYLDITDAEGVLDYAELVHRTRLLLLEDDVRARLLADHDLVVVDEFAECDPSQWRLVADLARAGLEVVAFADPTTRLFEFRGADARVVPDYLEALSELHPDRLVLDIDHRVPETTQVRIAANPGAETRGIAAVLTRARVDDGLPWRDMAVVCRTGGAELARVARGLAGLGIPVDVDGNDLVLDHEPAPRPLLAGLRLSLALVRGQVPDADALGEWLVSPLIGFDPLELRRVERELAASLVPASAADVVRRAADGEEADDPTAGRLAKAGALLGRVAAGIRGGAGAHELLWTLWSASSWSAALEEEALAGDESSRRAHRDLDAVVALFDLAGRMENLAGERGVEALLDAVANQEIPSDTTRESNVRDAGVTIVTAHGAKGREWPVVVVQGVQEGTWPARRVRSLLLDPRDLDPRLVAERPGDAGSLLVSAPAAAALAASVADDRRALLAAMSRASRTLVLTACDTGDDLVPSRFLRDLGVEPLIVPDVETRATSLPRLLARLRQVALDPTTPRQLQEAAVRRLARLARARDAQDRPLVRGADPVTWWGTAELTRSTVPFLRKDTPPSLTGSELESIVTCPRRWFLSRRARAEQQRTSAQGFGSLVHVLAEHVTRGTIQPEDIPGRLDDAWPSLEFAAPWQASAERDEAGRAMDRFLTWHEQRPFRVLGVEVAFQQEVLVDSRPVLLRGVADRVELDDEGGLRIVDFKTGSTVATKDDAALSPQLGLYQLAAAHGAFDAISGGARRLGGAELVYLRAEVKGGLPAERYQPSLDTHPWPLGGEPVSEVAGRPTWVHEILAAAVEVITGERTDAVAGPQCRTCPFRPDCPALTGEGVVR